MTLLVVFIGLLVVFIAGSILLLMLAFGQARTAAGEKAAGAARAPFGWRAVLLPVIIFVLVVGMCAWFYGKLPDNPASKFASDGTPTAFAGNRAALMAWALAPQFLLALLSVLAVWGVGRVSAMLRGAGQSTKGLDGLLLVMGNMVALPQLILAFAMLNTFGYNAYQTRLVPLWAIVIVVVIAGAIILGAFFISTIRKAAGGGK